MSLTKLLAVILNTVHRLDVESDSKLQEETKNINVSLHNFSKVRIYVHYM